MTNHWDPEFFTKIPAPVGKRHRGALPPLQLIPREEYQRILDLIRKDALNESNR